MTPDRLEPHSADLDQLLARIALKDRAAFDALYARTANTLFAVAVRIMKNHAEAEDVLQEVFVRVWLRAQNFRPGQAKAMSWLIAITRNLCIDRKRVKRVPIAQIEMAEAIPDMQPTPEAAAATAQDRDRISRCLDQLEERRAEAVRAAYIEGYSYQELAERFETPINTMRTWLRRSLMRLRDCLEQPQS